LALALAAVFFTARLRVFFGSSAITKSFIPAPEGDFSKKPSVAPQLPDQPTAPKERSGDLEESRRLLEKYVIEDG
jgi:hypothetical protein